MIVRVIVEGEEDTTFDTEVDAVTFATRKKRATSKVRTPDGKRPKVTIHDCGHDEGKPCINWEEV